MSYDLLFFKERQGESLDETLETLREAEPDEIDPQALLDIRQIADALLDIGLAFQELKLDEEAMAQKMSLTVEELLKRFTFIGLDAPEEANAPVQIAIERPMVVISIPYWHYDATTIAATKRYLELTRKTLIKQGLAGYDPQRQESIPDGFFEPMIDAIHQIRELTLQKLKEERPDSHFA